MRHLLLIPLLMLPTCWEQEPLPSIPFEEVFTLAYGESCLVGPEEIEIGFSELLTEGRCPSDVLCSWAGRARIQLWLHRPGQDTIYLEPFIYGYVSKENTAAHKSVYSRKYKVTLLQLDPYPSSHTVQLVPADYEARLSVALNPVPLETDRLNLLAHDIYAEFLNNPIDGFYIDSTAVTGDTLRVYVAYGGGCKEHDFFLFGSTAWDENVPPLMPAVIIHDGHWDTCEAFIHETLRFDLSPIRTWQGHGGEVVIHVKDAPDSVLYHF